MIRVQVSLHDGVVLLRGANDGHRSNGIGPGEYDGEQVLFLPHHASTADIYGVMVQNMDRKHFPV